MLSDPLPFTVILLLVLLIARVLGEIVERFGYPAMIGEILAGIILGPTILNYIHPSSEIKVLSELGIFLLMVLAGIEISYEEIRSTLRGRSAWIAVMGFLIPMACGILIGIIFDMNLTLTLFIGLCISITALPVSVRILMDLGRLQTHIGRKIITAAIFNDVIALLLLGVIIDANDTTITLKELFVSVLVTVLKVGAFILIITGFYRGTQRLIARFPLLHNRVDRVIDYLKGKESLFAMTILFVLFFASISELMGLHFIVGAFFGAMLLNKEILGYFNFEKIKRNITVITMGFLAPVFFAYMGIQFDFFAIGNYWLLLIILLFSFASKIAGGYLGGMMAGLDHDERLTLGVGLNARGIMELVIANIALQQGFINVSVYSILVLMGIITTLVSPALLKIFFNRLDRRNGGDTIAVQDLENR